MLHTGVTEISQVETSSNYGDNIGAADDQSAEIVLPSSSDVETPIEDTGESLGDERPAGIPEKFWNAKTGELRTETLLKSYVELEKKLGNMVPLPDKDDPGSRDRLQRVLGKPESADGYEINPPHELITPNADINAKLHEAGLSSEQAQLVYDLAAEHLLPIVDEMHSKANQQIERSQLAAHFGGEQKWQAMAPQIKTWAEANLSDDVYDSLGSSADGVIAIYHMMQTREPNVISEAAVPASGVDQRQLSQMMRDPRYWRDRDPAFVAEVTAGYRKLFDQ